MAKNAKKFDPNTGKVHSFLLNRKKMQMCFKVNVLFLSLMAGMANRFAPCKI